MNCRSLPENHYQFLHLTVQEFFAARYMASDKFTSIEKLTFLREHIDNVRYRMTLLFLAGLTKLDFVPNKETMLGSETTDLTEPLPLLNDMTPDTFDPYSRGKEVTEQKDHQKFMFVAHLLYESQIKQLDTSLALISNTIIISLHSFSPFDEIVLANFLSITPKTHIWNMIDLSGCALKTDSVLYSTPLSTDSEIIAMGMTKCLKIHSISIPKMVRIINTSNTLREVYLDIAFNQLEHNEVVEVSTAIGESNTLEIVEMSEWTDGIIISEKKLKIKNVPEMCCLSLIKLFNFEKKGLLKCLKIPNSNAFQYCTTCQSFDLQVNDSICKVLERNGDIEKIDLSNCDLQPEVVYKIVIVCGCNTKLKKLKIDGNDMSDHSVQKLLELSGRGIELTFLGMHLVPQETCLRIVNTHPYEISIIEDVFQQHQFPVKFDSIEVDINLSPQVIAYFLTNNQHLRQITLPEYYYCENDSSFTVESTLKMVNAITTHDSLQLFSGLSIKISKHLLDINSFSYICVTAVKMLLEFLDYETVEEVSWYGFPSVESQDEYISDIVTMVIKKLCEVIKHSRCLRSLYLNESNLHEHLMEMIVSSLEESFSEDLKKLRLSGNDINARSVTKLLHIFQIKQIKYMEIYQSSVNIEGNSLALKVLTSLYKTSRLNYLLKILVCPPEIKYLAVSSAEGDKRLILDLDVLASFLIANPCFVEINLPLMDSNHEVKCDSSLSFAKALSAHTSMKKISLHVRAYFIMSIIISRQRLDIRNLITCPKSLPYLLAFVTPENMESFDLSGYFKDCPSCGSKGEIAQKSFVECLAKCVNLTKLVLSGIPKSMIDKFASVIHSCPKLQFLAIPFSEPSAKSLTLIFGMTALSLAEVCVSNFIVTVHDHINMLIRKPNIVADCSYLSTILQSLTQIPDCELRKLHIDKDIALTDDHIEGFKFFLENECKIDFLSLSRNIVSPSLMKNLIQCMESNTTLRELHLNSIYLSSENAILMIKAIVHNQTLKNLDLSTNYIARDCEPIDLGIALQELLENNQSLSVLNLSECGLPVAVIHYIEMGLFKNTTLTELDLSCHNFQSKKDSEEFGKSIENILDKNKSLQVLSLIYYFVSLLRW